MVHSLESTHKKKTHNEEVDILIKKFDAWTAADEPPSPISLPASRHGLY